MTERKPISGADLIAGIVKGQVPRQVRLFAAQGLLPISREELLGLQCVLSSDPNEELAKVAADSVRGEELNTILDWIRDHPPESLVLDQLIRVRDEEAVWAAVASHANVSDETLRVIAKNATPMVQDIIITNQVRVLGCLEILDDLRANPQINQVVLRRVREFEEEFIAKVLAQEEAAAAAGPSVEEAIEALHSIGAHIPKEITMPYPLTGDEELAEAVKKAGESVHGRLLNMSVHERIVCALRGTREERAILVNSRNRLIQRSVLACPKLSDSEIEQYASSRSVAQEVIKLIADNRRWLRQYPVIVALALNPKTPVYTAKSILPRLTQRDKMRVSRDRNLPPVTRKIAEKLLDTRR
jgi:hypothetical protein